MLGPINSSDLVPLFVSNQELGKEERRPSNRDTSHFSNILHRSCDSIEAFVNFKFLFLISYHVSKKATFIH